MDRVFAEWMRALESRHLADLTFSEVTRGLRALSSTYVERRGGLARGSVFSGAGKRAAFALFYGPLHALLVRHVVCSLPGAVQVRGTILDLGCGTGTAGAAWATSPAERPTVFGIERHPWTAEEARWTYRQFGLEGRVRTSDLRRAPFPAGSHVRAAFVVNELDDASRETLMHRLLAHRARGGRVLVVEPLAGFVVPWWSAWQQAFEDAGGRADEWRVRAELPPLVGKLDRAAGLDHEAITGRTLWL